MEQASIHAIDWLVVLAYLVGIMASLASTVGYLGDPGEVIRHGVGILMRQIGLPFAAAITILVVVPFFQWARITTAFELVLWPLSGAFLIPPALQAVND